MFEIKESEWIWQRLQQEKHPIVLYGMGNGADKILSLCEQFHIPVQDLFASDEFVRGQNFAGFQVKTYAQICALYQNPVILVAFGTEQPEVLERIYKMAEQFEVLAPDVPLFGDDIADFSWLKQHQDEVKQVYDQLADETSQQNFEALLAYKLTGKIHYLKQCETPRDEVFQHLFSLDKQEVYIDLGAYDGDTIREFMQQTQGKYQKIVAFEPDRKNYVKLQRNATEQQWQHTELLPYASWDKAEALVFSGKGGRNSALGDKGYVVQAESVDHVLQGDKASYIKMDVEGAERPTLLGCRETIRSFAPKLAVSAYHRTWDIITLPLLLWQLNPSYQVYLRHHPYVPAWETNLYAVQPDAAQTPKGKENDREKC